MKRQVVLEDQTCAVPGRTISDSLILIGDIIWDVKDRGQNLALASLDFEKTYDRVAHEFLFRVLKKMGFPDTYKTDQKFI